MKKLFLAVLLLFPSIPIFSQLPNYVPAHGLAGWWSFSGNANDLSGHNAHGTVLGPALTADRHGNPNSAYQFDGMDDYILMGDPTPGHLSAGDQKRSLRKNIIRIPVQRAAASCGNGVCASSCE